MKKALRLRLYKGCEVKSNLPFVRFAFHPVFWAVAGAMFPLIAYLTPESVYFGLINERKAMDLQTLLYVASCVAAFCFGYYSLPPLRSFLNTSWRNNRAVSIVVLAHALIIAANIIVIVRLPMVVGVSGVLEVMWGDASALILYDAHMQNLEGLRPILVTAAPIVAISLWTGWFGNLPRRSRTLLFWLTGFTVLITFVRATLGPGERGQLFIVLFAVALTWAYRAYRSGRLRNRRLLAIACAIVFLGVAYFNQTQSSRYVGYAGYRYAPENFLVEQVFGYYIAGYNRLAVVVDGEVGENTSGYLTTRWIWEFPVLSSVFGLHSWAEDEFDIVAIDRDETFTRWSDVGFNQSFIQTTAFAPAFWDYRWGGFLVFVLYGWITKISFVSFKRDGIFGVMSYPIILFSILEWRGKLEFFNVDSAIQFIVALGFTLLFGSMISPHIRSSSVGGEIEHRLYHRVG